MKKLRTNSKIELLDDNCEEKKEEEGKGNGKGKGKKEAKELVEGKGRGEQMENNDHNDNNSKNDEKRNEHSGLQIIPSFDPILDNAIFDRYVRTSTVLLIITFKK